MVVVVERWFGIYYRQCLCSQPSGVHVCVGICCRIREGNPQNTPAGMSSVCFGFPVKEISKGGRELSVARVMTDSR